MSLENKKWFPRLCSGSDSKKKALFLAQSAPIKEEPTPTRPTVAPTKRPTVVTVTDEVTNKPTAVTESPNRPTAITDKPNRPTAAATTTTVEDEPEVPTPSK